MQHHTLFSDKSDLYERARPEYPAELYDYLASICGANELVWDAACGNGQASIDLAQHFARVAATDISEQQIENAKRGPNIDYAVSASESTELGDKSCDLVCVAQALHWFDYDLFWPEVNRVLKDNGVFATWGYNWTMIDSTIDRLFRELVLDVVAPYWAPQNQLIWDHYKDIDFPFDKIESPRFDMSVSWNAAQYLDFIHTFSATRRCMDDIGDGFFREASEAIAQAWGDVGTKKQVKFDFVFYAGRKRSSE